MVGKTKKVLAAICVLVFAFMLVPASAFAQTTPTVPETEAQQNGAASTGVDPNGIGASDLAPNEAEPGISLLGATPDNMNAVTIAKSVTGADYPADDTFDFSVSAVIPGSVVIAAIKAQGITTLAVGQTVSIPISDGITLASATRTPDNANAQMIYQSIVVNESSLDITFGSFATLFLDSRYAATMNGFNIAVSTSPVSAPANGETSFALLSGASLTVSEADKTNYEHTSASADDTAYTATDNKTLSGTLSNDVKLSFENSYTPPVIPELTIKKTVTGDDDTFKFNLDCEITTPYIKEALAAQGITAVNNTTTYDIPIDSDIKFTSATTLLNGSANSLVYSSATFSADGKTMQLKFGNYAGLFFNSAYATAMEKATIRLNTADIEITTTGGAGESSVRLPKYTKWSVKELAKVSYDVESVTGGTGDVVSGSTVSGTLVGKDTVNYANTQVKKNLTVIENITGAAAPSSHIVDLQVTLDRDYLVRALEEAGVTELTNGVPVTIPAPGITADYTAKTLFSGTENTLIFSKAVAGDGVITLTPGAFSFLNPAYSAQMAKVTLELSKSVTITTALSGGVYTGQYATELPNGASFKVESRDGYEYTNVKTESTEATDTISGVTVSGSVLSDTVTFTKAYVKKTDDVNVVKKVTGDNAVADDFTFDVRVQVPYAYVRATLAEQGKLAGLKDRDIVNVPVDCGFTITNAMIIKDGLTTVLPYTAVTAGADGKSVDIDICSAFFMTTDNSGHIATMNRIFIEVRGTAVVSATDNGAEITGSTTIKSFAGREWSVTEQTSPDYEQSSVTALTASIVGENRAVGNTEDTVTFSNYYISNTVSLSLNPQKSVAGKLPETPETVSFSLTPLDGAPDAAARTITMTAPIAEGVAETTVDAWDITFIHNGTYRYTAKEIAGDLASCDYDASIYTVEVVVATAENAGFTDYNGNPVAAGERYISSVTFTKNGSPAAALLFTNTYLDKGENVVTATDSSGYASKSASWTNAEKTEGKIQIVTSTNTSVTMKTLFLGSLCHAHSLMPDTINKSLTAILQYSDVDYYMVGAISPDASTITVGPFEGTYLRGDTPSVCWPLDGGAHGTVYQFAEQIIAKLKNNSYDILVLEFDGIALGHANREYTAAELTVLREAAELLKPYYDANKVLWIASDSNPAVPMNPAFPIDDCANWNSIMTTYWNDPGVIGITVRTEFNSMALLDPTTWLSLTKADGTNDVTTPPPIESFTPSASICYYDDEAELLNYLIDILDFKIIVDDTLADGLTIDTTKIVGLYLDEATGRWETITDASFTVSINANGKITSVFDGKEYIGKKIMLELPFKASEDFYSKEGATVETNKGQAEIDYSFNGRLDPIYMLDSPGLSKDKTFPTPAPTQPSTTETPNTGDGSHILLYAGLLTLSLAGLACLLAITLRRKSAGTDKTM